MNYSFTDYEKAVLNALFDLKVENGGYLLALDAYANHLDTPQALKIWVGRFPAMTVIVPEAEYPDPERTNIYWRQNVRVFVIAGAHSWRGQDAARGGADGSVGVQKMLADMRARLLNKRLGLEIRPCLPVREVPIASDLTTVIVSAEYKIINDRILEENP